MTDTATVTKRETMTPGVYDRQGAADYLGINPRTLDKILESGDLRHSFLGDPDKPRAARLLRIREAWLIEYLENRAMGGSHSIADDILTANECRVAPVPGE